VCPGRTNPRRNPTRHQERPKAFHPMKAGIPRCEIPAKCVSEGDLNPLDHPHEAQQTRGVQRVGEFTGKFSGHRGTPRGTRGQRVGHVLPGTGRERGDWLVGRTPRSRAASVDRTAHEAVRCRSAPPTYANANPAPTDTATRLPRTGTGARCAPADHEVTPNSTPSGGPRRRRRRIDMCARLLGAGGAEDDR